MLYMMTRSVLYVEQHHSGQRIVMEKMVMLNSKKSEDISSEPDYSSEPDNIPDDEVLPF